MKKAKRIFTQSKPGKSLLSGLNFRLRTGSLTLVLLGLSLSVQAQFIRVNLDVEPQTSLSESGDLALLLRPIDKTELSAEWMGAFREENDFSRGHYSLQIRGNENFSVQATIHNTPVLLNDQGESLPLMVQLSYRNDGLSLPPYKAGSNRLYFPLSDRGLLIEHMKDNPQVLVASVYVQVTVAGPVLSTKNYRGDIYLKLEYN